MYTALLLSTGSLLQDSDPLYYDYKSDQSGSNPVYNVPGYYGF